MQKIVTKIEMIDITLWMIDWSMGIDQSRMFNKDMATPRKNPERIVWDSMFSLLPSILKYKLFAKVLFFMLRKDLLLKKTDVKMKKTVKKSFSLCVT